VFVKSTRGFFLGNKRPVLLEEGGMLKTLVLSMHGRCKAIIQDCLREEGGGDYGGGEAEPEASI